MLKSRQMQIPNGLFFYQPQTKWRSRHGSSFDSIVDQLIHHRKANPRFNLPTDKATVEAEVDAFNAKVCKTMGWTDYITEGGPANPVPFPPSPPRSFPRTVRQVAAGGAVLIDWVRSGAEAVPAPLANARAATCAACPKNEQGDWTSWFTVPTSNKIQSEIQRRKNMQLSTPSDGNLKVCSACLCPLLLKVHVPLNRILAKMPKEVLPDLATNCWILTEQRP